MHSKDDEKGDTTNGTKEPSGVVMEYHISFLSLLLLPPPPIQTPKALEVSNRSGRYLQTLWGLIVSYLRNRLDDSTPTRPLVQLPGIV